MAIPLNSRDRDFWKIPDFEEDYRRMQRYLYEPRPFSYDPRDPLSATEVRRLEEMRFRSADRYITDRPEKMDPLRNADLLDPKIQSSCLMSGPGSVFMENFDALDPEVRAAVRDAPFNLCAACIASIAMQRGTSELRAVALIVDALRRAEARKQFLQPRF